MQRGFTLIEMVTVLAIITVITGITLVNQSTFNRSIILTDTSYTVALSIRETQSLGLSSKGFQGVSNAGYGIDFSVGDLTSYRQFADASKGLPTPGWCPTGVPNTVEAKPGNCLYDGPVRELVRKFDFNQGFTIGNFCAYTHPNGVLTKVGCSDSSNNALTALDIVFERPNVQTVITAVSESSYQSADTACIQISAPGGKASRYVEINQLGEVFVTQTCT